jgi:hypothetical protein
LCSGEAVATLMHAHHAITDFEDAVGYAIEQVPVV